MRFTLKQLDYFVAAGEACSIRKASESLNVSQPSISTAVSQLEKEFQTQFFIRHHAQGLSLTTAGREFLREAKLYMSHGHTLEQMATNLSSEIAGRLEVACFSPLAPFIIPAFCHRFAADHSGVQLNVTEANQQEIFASLRNGNIDLAITYDLDLPADIHFQPLISLPPYAVLAESHQLAQHDQLRLSELTEWPLVLMDLPLSKDYFLSLFQQRGLVPTVLTKTPQSEVMRSLVGMGYGYGLANVRPINRMTLDGNDLVYVKLDEEHVSLTLGLLTLRSLNQHSEFAQNSANDENVKPINKQTPDTHYNLSKSTLAFAAFTRKLLSSGHVPGMEKIQ